jgi:hypothetical protein
VVAAAPIIQYALLFPHVYNTRLESVGLYQSGLIWRYVAERRVSELEVLLDQFKLSALAFTGVNDPTFWYRPQQPLLDSAAGALFVLGLGYATLHLTRVGLFPMAAWYWGVVIAGGVLTENPPSSMRLTSLALPAVFFVALALERTAALAQRALAPLGRLPLTPFLAAVVAALCLSSVAFYFLRYTPTREYGNPNAVVATALAVYARDQVGPGGRIYFFGPGRMFYSFGTISYLAPEVEGVDVMAPLTAPPPPTFVAPDRFPVFVFLPERSAELDLVRRTFPGGRVSEIPSPTRSAPLFIVYRL